MTNDPGSPWQTLSVVRQHTPMIHNLINPIAMDLAANLLLAVGASPVMTSAEAEIEDVVAKADAVSINLATPAPDPGELLASAARRSVECGRPWVLDPVGCPTSEARLQVARRLTHLQPTVIRGNGSEVLVLGSRSAARSRGVDSLIDSTEALDAARDLAKATGAIVAVTGVVDYVTDGKTIRAVANGDRMMTKVTGVGCALTCLIAAFCAANGDPMAATIHALAVLGVAGELAVAEVAGPGSFRVGLLDALYNLDETTLDVVARVQ